MGSGSRNRHARQLAAAARRAARDPARAAAKADGLIVFACPDGHHTVTVRLEDGAVPGQLGCRHPVFHCPHQALQVMDVLWDGKPPEPGWEWYRPDPAAWVRIRDRGGPLWEHIHAGGLLIRERKRLR